MIKWIEKIAPSWGFPEHVFTYLSLSAGLAKSVNTGSDQDGWFINLPFFLLQMASDLFQSVGAPRWKEADLARC